MNGRHLWDALSNGATCVGAFVKVPSPDLVELLALFGSEFIVADAKHGPTSPVCHEMVRAAEAKDVPLLVRVGEASSPPTVNRFLDTGVSGVHLPRISSARSRRNASARFFIRRWAFVD
jgi:4-hydroxy-2-oxoheptanedioate aldolase